MFEKVAKTELDSTQSILFMLNIKQEQKKTYFKSLRFKKMQKCILQFRPNLTLAIFFLFERSCNLMLLKLKLPTNEYLFFAAKTQNEEKTAFNVPIRLVQQ